VSSDFLSSAPLLSRAELLDLAQRSLRCSSAQVRLDMKRGLNGLASIASTAPLVGLFGTVIGVLDSFKGCIGQKWFCEMMVLEGITEALVSTALGLLVAVPAVWFYNHLSNKLEAFDIEMKLASLELTTYLALRLRLQENSGSREALPSPSAFPTVPWPSRRI
jgi:biopolymer transport protein ExbB/biopolymer transport protein TolQ